MPRLPNTKRFKEVKMKEVKFRLRDRHNKIVGYEKWYEGCWKEEEPEAYPNTSRYIGEPTYLYSLEGMYWRAQYIPHRYKDQYIGLLDMSSKEIYDGDILADSPTGDWKQTKVPVVWADGCYWCIFIDGTRTHVAPKFRLDKEHCTVWKVIGNVYENPELLTSQKEI